MLFGSTDLAARLERAERRLVSDCAEAIARRRPELGVISAPLAGGLAVWSGPGSPFNKVVGVGFDGPLDEAELGRLELEIAGRGSAVQVELSNLAEPAIGESLTRRGYLLRGYENVLGLRLDGELAWKPEHRDVEIAQSPPSELGAWMEVVVTAFANPDAQGLPSHETFERGALKSVLQDVVAVPGLLRYAARRGGVLAGGASMRLCEGVAQLCGAATLPEYRSRGVQTALLAERLAIARGAGCDVAVVTTQPGSKSQENAQRRGFELLYCRAVLVRDPVQE